MFFKFKNPPTTAGTYYAIDAPEFQTHASGQLLQIIGPPGRSPEEMIVSKLTTEDSGFYRNPLPLSTGELVTVHADTNSFEFRLKKLVKEGEEWTAGQTLTSGISKTISFWNPDQLENFSGDLWELSPVEVRSRPRPSEECYGTNP